MPISRTIPLPALLWMFLCFVTPAHAAALNVPGQYPTIQAAITASQNGDTVLVTDGTYSGPGNRDIDFGGKNITVTSQRGAASTVIDCGGSSSSDGSGNHRAFYFHNGETAAVISGLTIKNGYEANVSGGADSGTGGGICIIGSSAVIKGCTITSNIASEYGGGIYTSGSTGKITLTDCTLSSNSTSGFGGGIYNDGVATLSTCTLSSNSAPDGGGIGNGGAATLTDCALTSNSATFGGGLYNGGGTATLTNCTFYDNMVSSGGGIYNSNGSATLTSCALTFNFAGPYGSGGGVSNVNGRATLTNCALTFNFAGPDGNGYGGGINNSATATLTNDIVYGDTGGEIINSGNGASTVTFCDVQGGYSGEGNVNADPLFVYAAGGNLHLRPGSPCLGAGTSAGAPTTDKDGVTRPSPPSIGAYEATPSHTHLLWNNSDGRVMFWNVAADGSFTVSGFGPYTDDYVSSDPNNKWHATALAAAPDGTSRIVWNNVDHRVMLWSLDAQGNVLSVTGYGPYTDTYVSSSPGNLWSAVGVSVGPDGLTHLLWGNTDRRMMFWDLDAQGDLLGLSGYGPYTDTYVSQDPANVWSATALATGPDNVSRVVWNNVDHRVMLWTLGGPGGSSVRGIAGYGPYTDTYVSSSPGNLWSAVGVSVGPDNLTHLLWGNTDRRAMFWDVDSSFGFTLAGYGPYTDNGASNLWSATALATGPDGLSHLLWGNTDDRAMLWGVDNAFDFTVAGYGPYTDDAPGNLWSATAVSAGP